MKYLYKLSVFITIIFLFFFQTNNVLAKSTNKNDFLKLSKEAYKLQKEGKKEEAYLLRLKLDNNFNVDKLKIVDGNGGKGDFYFNICLGAKMFNRTENRLKETIYFCNKSYEYYEKSNTFKIEGFDFVESFLDDALSFHYAWNYQFNGSEENKKKANKHASKLLKYKNSKVDQTFYINGLKVFAIVNRADGNHDEVIKYMRMVIKGLDCNNDSKISKATSNRDCYSQKTDLAAALQDRGASENYSEAKKIYEKLIDNEKKYKPFKTDMAAVRIGLYSYYANYGNYEQAEKNLYDALGFIDPEDPVSTEMYFQYKSRLFTLLTNMGYVYEARIGYEKLVKEIRDKYGEYSVQLINPLGSLLSFYVRDEDKGKALAELNNLIKIKEKNKNYRYSTQTADAYIAQVYSQLGKDVEAEKYLIKAIALNPVNIDSIILDLVLNNIRLKKYDEAKKNLKKITRNDNYSKIKYYNALSRLYYSTQNMDKYKKVFVDYYSLLSDYSKGFIKTNETSSINYYTHDILQLMDGLTNLPEKEYSTVAKYFKQKKGQNINNAIVEMFEVIRSSTVNTRVQNVIDRSKDLKVAKEKRKLQDLVIEFEKISRDTKNEVDEKKLYQELKVVKKKITNQRRIVLKKLNLSNVSNFSEEITLEDIQKNLNEDQGIISYFIDSFYLYIFSITNEDIRFKKIKIKNKKIKSHIQKIINTVKVNNSNRLKDFNFNHSNQLYDLIFKPIEATIENKRDLIIIPHKALMSLPFEILTKDKIKQSNKIDYQKVKWVGKKYSISYYPSIYSFYNLQKIKSKNNENSFVGFGDPEFSSKKDIKLASKTDYSKLTMSRGVADADEIRKLSELPETSDELKFIANIFKGKSKLYLRKDFDEEKIKSLDLSNYKYISFATHAIVADQIDNISEPGIILTPPKKSTKINDGILTVSEIERLKLNSDIVILSACNTASEDGSPNAEGLSGLTSAFFQAGTKSMMVTHWDVETNSAVTLTTGTFDKMKGLKNLSKAMHKTKIEMMNDPKTSHPLFWAPFVLIGNVNY